MKEDPMKAVLATLLLSLGSPLFAQQFTPPSLPPGVKSAGESAEGAVLKVYSMEDQGHTFRAYVVKYKGSEVIIPDNLSTTSKKVGDNVKFVVARVEVPSKVGTFNTMSFQIMNPTLTKK